MDQVERKKQLKRRVGIFGAVGVLGITGAFLWREMLWKKELRVQSVWAQNALRTAEVKAEGSVILSYWRHRICRRQSDIRLGVNVSAQRCCCNFGAIHIRLMS